MKLKFVICSDWHQLFQDWRDSFVSKNSDFLITTSKRLKELIVNKSQVNQDKIIVAYGGVDLKKFENLYDKKSLRKELSLPEDDFLVGYVGFYKTMNLEKGLTTMINSLEHIKDKNIKMVFVGGKKHEIDEYGLYARKNNYIDRCLFFGKFDNEDVSMWLQVMDVLVIPYPNHPHFTEWGLPMKIYEYMASGRPIIYSDLGIMKEVLGNCSISFKSNNPNSLARKIIAISKDQILAEHVARSAFQKVWNYTWEKRAKNILVKATCLA